MLTPLATHTPARQGRGPAAKVTRQGLCAHTRVLQTQRVTKQRSQVRMCAHTSVGQPMLHAASSPQRITAPHLTDPLHAACSRQHRSVPARSLRHTRRSSNNKPRSCVCIIACKAPLLSAAISPIACRVPTHASAHHITRHNKVNKPRSHDVSPRKPSKLA